jgi:haloalkane dehalogenase
VTLVGHDWGGALAEIERHDAVAGHHTPEDHPLAIAKAVAEWADRHRLR